MEPELLKLLLLGGASALGAIAIAFERARARRREAALPQESVLGRAGAVLGLRRIAGVRGGGDAFGGRIGSRVGELFVGCDTHSQGRRDHLPDLLVRAEHLHIPRDLVIRPKSRTKALAVEPRSTAALLEHVTLSGDPLTRHALFDDATLAEVLDTVLTTGMSVENGIVQLDLHYGSRGAGDPLALEEDDVVRQVRAVVALAERVCLERDAVGERLANIAARDPSPVMRRSAIERLVAVFPSGARTADVCRRALDDEDGEVRFTGALHLGVEGLPVVKVTAEDETARPELRARALQHLATRTPGEVAPLVAAALGSHSPVVLTAALETLMRREVHAPAIDTIEARLLGLAGHEDDAIALLAMDALGRHGTASAVLPLRELGSGLFAARDRADHAKAAIASIQDRIGHVEHGALAIVGSDAGAGDLSIAEAGGDLSIAKGGGEVSLTDASGAPTNNKLTR